MINKESIYNLTELLLIGSVTTAGFLIGGTVGASVMAGLGINLTSNILDKGSSNLKSKWINGKDGILNHDIQRALLRAFNKSILEIEEEYLELDYVKNLSKENTKTVKQFFKSLKDNTQKNFNSILTNILNGNQIQDYLSKEPKEAENLLWKKINLDVVFQNNNTHIKDYYDGYEYDNKHLKEYFKTNLHYKIKFWFSEELKTDSKENNKAWRAFQRLLLEGIKDDINSVEVNQEEIKKDLKKLEKIEQSINELKNIIDKRSSDEPFFEDFENGTRIELDEILSTSIIINKTTKNIESKVDLIIDNLDITEQKENSKKINEKLLPLIKEIKKFRKENDYDKAENLYEEAKTINNLDDYSIAKLKLQYSFIIKNKYYDIKKEDDILIECLNVFQKYGIEDDIDTVKRLLIQTKSSLHEFDTAEVFANDILSNAKNEKEFADAHIFLGLVLFQKQDLKGAISEMDNAIKYGNKLLIKNAKEELDEGVEIITYATQNKSLFFKRLGRLNEAKSSSIKAIEGLRKLKKKKELGMALFEITELSVLQGNFKDGKWSEYIEEAKSIFRDVKDFSWLARCYDLIAKIAFMSNQPELALSIFEEGYKEIQKTNDKNGVAHFLGKFVSFYIHQKDVENAKKSLSNYIDYSKKNNIERAITESKEYSLRIAEIDGKADNKEEHLNNLITVYEKEYNNEQSEISKAFILGKIASIYEEQDKLILALNTFKKVSKEFKKLDVSSEYAKSLLMINQLKIKLGYKDGLFETWQEVLKILDGTSYHPLIAIANINCGSHLLETKNYEKAQRYLEEAEYYILKYKLPYKKDVKRLLDEVKERRDFSKPPNHEFKYIIDRLYFGINKNKDDFKPLLRHWFSKYQNDIFKYFINKPGLNIVLYINELKLIESITNRLSWLFNYSLIASDEEISKSSYDLIADYPYEDYEKGETLLLISEKDAKSVKENPRTLEQKLLEKLNEPSNDGKKTQYSFSFYETAKKDEVKTILFGWGIGLPPLTYDFFEKNDAKSVLNGKLFPIHQDRYTLKDKLYADIILCWKINFFPVYLNETLHSDRIITLAKTEIKIPFETEFNKSKSNSIKRLFNSLFKIEKSNVKTSLNDFKFDVDILTEDMEKSILLNVSIIEVQHSVRNFVYPIIIINENFE